MSGSNFGDGKSVLVGRWIDVEFVKDKICRYFCMRRGKEFEQYESLTQEGA